MPTREAKQVTMVGNMTEDPTLAYSAGGTAYTRFSIAVDRPKVPGNWSGERETLFYRVVCFKSLAENVAESLAKGNRVIVSGKGEVERYEKKDGTTATANKITADHVGAELRFATATVARVGRKSPVNVDADGNDPF